MQNIPLFRQQFIEPWLLKYFKQIKPRNTYCTIFGRYNGVPKAHLQKYVETVIAAPRDSKLYIHNAPRDSKLYIHNAYSFLYIRAKILIMKFANVKVQRPSVKMLRGLWIREVKWRKSLGFFLRLWKSTLI